MGVRSEIGQVDRLRHTDGGVDERLDAARGECMHARSPEGYSIGYTVVDLGVGCARRGVEVCYHSAFRSALLLIRDRW